MLHEWIKNRSAEDILSTLVYMVQTVKASNGIGRVLWINVDRERAIPAIERKLVVALETLLKQPVPYKHERMIERSVRTMRNRYRTTLGDLQVKVTKQLARLAWEHAVKASNFIQNVHSGEFLPFQIQHGAKEYRTPPKFGEFVVAPVGKLDNKIEPRRQVAMIVGFEERTRAVQVKFKGLKDVFTRDSYSVIADQKQGRDRFMEDDEDSDDEEMDVEASVQTLDDTDIEGLIGGEVNMDLSNINNLSNINTTINPTQNHSEDTDIETPESEDDELEDDNIQQQPRRSGREPKINRQPDFIYAAIKQVLDKQAQRSDATTTHIDYVCGLVEEAAIKGDDGKKAAAKLELQQVWLQKGAIAPVKLTKEQLRNKMEVIKSKLFVIEKLDASNNFIKNKARLVARGDLRRDKPSATLETFSPTGSFPTFMTLLNIILLNKLCFMTADVETAYLNALFDGTVFMKLDPKVASLMVELDPKATDYLEEDGSMYVQIIKALYGLQESAKLWYNTLADALIKLGFRRSSYDQALFFQRTGEDTTFVFVYVDDMLFAGRKNM